MRALLSLSLLLAVAPAAAQDAGLTTHLFVERDVAGQDRPASTLRLLPIPERLRRGDRVVVVVSAPFAAGLAIVQPVPAVLRFAGARGERLSLSVDGGRTFGPLAALAVSEADGGERAAGPADVTHVRWAAPPMPVARALFSFRAVVR